MMRRKLIFGLTLCMLSVCCISCGGKRTSVKTEQSEEVDYEADESIDQNENVSVEQEDDSKDIWTEESEALKKSEPSVPTDKGQQETESLKEENPEDEETNQEEETTDSAFSTNGDKYFPLLP